MIGHVLLACGLALLFVLVFWCGETCRSYRWQLMRYRRGLRLSEPAPPAAWVRALAVLAR